MGVVPWSTDPQGTLILKLHQNFNLRDGEFSLTMRRIGGCRWRIGFVFVGRATILFVIDLSCSCSVSGQCKL